VISKADFKNLFQSSLKDMLSKKENQKNDKTDMVLDYEYLDMILFYKLMEAKHNDIVSENDDDSMSIENTNNLFLFRQTNTPDKSYIKNKKKKNYDEIHYPFSKRIKLIHELEAAQENKPVHYTAYIILEIKNRDGTVVPMRALLDTGTTSTIILREFVAKGRARTNTKKRTKLKTLGGTLTTNYESVLAFEFPEISVSKVVPWQAHVDDNTSSKEAAYDMIMGMDLIKYIGITVDSEQRCIRWGGTEPPSKTRKTLSDNDILHMLYHAANAPDILQESKKRQHRILDSDYRKFR
jgi:predicted aspartyl protease